MRRLVLICLLISMALAASDSKPGIPVRYAGGTLPGCAAKPAARLYLPNPEALLLRCGTSEVTVAYNAITKMEYGQSLHRRYGTAAGTAALPVLWPVTAAILLKRSRKHFLTIEYAEAGGQRQAMVLRVEKDNIRALLAELEARAGRRFEYGDENARKSREP
jgi:hypothetical protein